MQNRLISLVGAVLACLVTASAQGAGWQQVASGRGERVDLDTGRISRNGEGRILAWTRLQRDKAVTDNETGVTYTALEVLSSYDCNGSRFAPVKRLYLDGEKLLRVENIFSPRDLPAGSSGNDAALMSSVCKQKVVAQAKAGESKAAAADGRFSVMHAEMVSDGRQTKGPLTTVAEKAPVTSAAPSAEGKGEAPKRFLELPKIDKSQVERPTDEPRPTEAKAGEKSSDKPVPAEKMSGRATEKALEKVADKVAEKMNSSKAEASPVDRRDRELALATSGIRRVVRKKPEPAEAAHAAVQEHKDIHWSYEGEGGPANWAAIDPKNAACATGKRQSPIDIGDGIRVDLEPIRFDYRPTQFRIEDNGHTIQVNVGEGSSITVMGRRYELKQFHFHRPSEERVNGKRFDMVAHLVHKDDDGNLAVVAVLLEKGDTEHPLIQTLWNNMPLEAGMSLSPATSIDLSKLLPDSRAYYTYMGSLTTPPCTENVLWMVFKQPVTLSQEQVSVFSRLYRNNARPLQPAWGRLIKESR